MKLIIGLGNPGKDYEKTRHNAGHMVIEELQKTEKTGAVFKKTDSFMNKSGEFVKNALAKYNTDLADLYIVHDDLDIKLGEFKIQFGRGPKDHNGLKSIDDALGSDEYWHVRVGIDNRPMDGKPMGEEYVLQNFTDDEKLILNKTIKEVAAKLS